jgi:hypothetical protein
MSFEKTRETVARIISRLDSVVGKGEQATRQALILPLIESLGYDIWNPDEVCPEYEADFKKAGNKERVDYAIFVDSLPRIYIETKPYPTTLEAHQPQLARYFNSTPSVSLAILTNGIEYWFYTDSKEPNMMDPEPFHTLNLVTSEVGLEVLGRFQKLVYAPEAIRDLAVELSYSAKMMALFRRELDLRTTDPSDAFVRWVLDQDMYDGRITSNVLERFRPLVKKSLQRVIREIVLRSFAALDDGIAATPQTEEVAQAIVDPQPMTDNGDGSGSTGIVTTERELECFAIIKEQFGNSSLHGKMIYDPTAGKEVPIEISYKDTTGYFGIYFNKPSWWITRIQVEAKKPWAGFNMDPEAVRGLLPPGCEIYEPSAHAQLRVAISSPADLHGLNRLIFAAFEKTINDRRTEDKAEAAR